MKAIGTTFVLSAVLLLLPSLALPAMAGENVPFACTASIITLSRQCPGPCGPNSCLYPNGGRGVAYHMGRIRVLIMYCTACDTASCQVHAPAFLTAANGDQVYLDLSASYPLPFSGIFGGQFVITGGTGQFANAFGRGVWSENAASRPFTFTFDGTIDYKKN